MGKDQKEFIAGLLGETQEQFREAFLGYAKSIDQEKRAKFVNLSIEMSKMIVPKPVEIDATIQASDFDELMGICTKWDDES